MSVFVKSSKSRVFFFSKPNVSFTHKNMIWKKLNNNIKLYLYTLFFLFQTELEVNCNNDNIDSNNCTNCTIVTESKEQQRRQRKQQQQQQQSNTVNSTYSMPSRKTMRGREEESKGYIQVTRPISPTVLLALQNKIKCKQCQACMKVKPNGKRKRPWLLICENTACTSPETQLRSTEALSSVIQRETAEEVESQRRENILKNCFEENY